jgi:hypothetical protein
MTTMTTAAIVEKVERDWRDAEPHGKRAGAARRPTETIRTST